VRAPAAIVLAAGAGARLRPLTLLRPKALCPVNNETLLDRTLDHVTRTGLTDVAVNAHHLAEQVVAHVGDRAHLSVERPAGLGTAGAVAYLRGWLADRDALICNADAYLDGDLHPLLTGWSGARPRVLVVSDPMRGDFGDWRFAGASLLPAAFIAALPESPAGLYETVWQAAFARGELELVAYQGKFIDCGTPADYLAANLHASGGSSVVGAGAVVEGQLVRSVVWPQAVVAHGERLVECVRADGGLTVDASGVAGGAGR